MAEENNNGNGLARWRLVAGIGLSVASVAAIVLGPPFWLYGQMTTLQLENSQNLRIVADLKTRVKTLEDRSAADRSEIAAERQELIEVETQFCAEDDDRNLMHAEDLREIAMLHEKVFGVVLPTANAFYPAICNHQIK